MLPETRMAKGACTLWQEDLLCDYTIEVEDEEFKVHKVIMASVSDYFKAMLTGGMEESGKDRVRLEGLSSLVVRNMIEFMYTGQFGSADAGLDQLLHCATYLQIPTAVEACTTSLCEQVDLHNCFRIHAIFRAYVIKDGIEYTTHYIKQNTEAIVEDFDPEIATYDDLLILMNAWESSEWGLFTITKKWLSADSERMNNHGNDLMTMIRFCLISPTELALVKDMVIFSETDGSWKDLIDKAVTYHNLPTHQKVLDESEQARVRSDQAPVCFEKMPSISNHVFAIQNDKSWFHHETINPPVFRERQFGDGFVIYTEANNFLIVCDYDGNWYIYDPRNSTWSTMASMGVPRKNFSIVHHDQHLYALGGEDMHCQTLDVIEKYDYETNTWVVINSRMPALMVNHKSFSIGSRIYIMDGWLPGEPEDDGEDTEGIYYLDTNTGEWTHRDGDTWQPGVMELDGEKVLSAFDRFHLRLNYYKPSIDQWLVYNHSTTSRLCDCDYSYVLTIGNTLFLLSFARENENDELRRHVHHTMFACEKWTAGKKGMTVDILDAFPLEPKQGSPVEESENYFCVLLAHQYKDTDIWKEIPYQEAPTKGCPLRRPDIHCTVCGI